MGKHQNIEDYLQRYLSNALSDEEKRALADMLDVPENLEKFSSLIEAHYLNTAENEVGYDDRKVNKMIQLILKEAPGPELSATEPTIITTKKRFSRTWIGIAAAMILAIGLWYIYNTPQVKEPIQSITEAPAIPKDDLPPGSQKAILTLSDGKKIELDDTGKQVINDGEIAIQNSEGALEYGKHTIVAYNTMTTPKGGQYKLKLPDGTLVWLNAASSITFPTAFTENTRSVAITGEAYFEVVKNEEKPFVVNTYGDKIVVTGTSFNINSYPEESGIKTSLLEGAVLVNGTILKPGNAYLNGKVSSADLGRDLAWKNGIFNFHHVKLEEAMRQIARWYDVEVVFDNKTNEIELGGEIGRNLTLKQLLNGLQDKEIQFTLKGKTLVVHK